MGNFVKLGCALALVSCTALVGCGEDHEAEEAQAFSDAYDELESGKADENGCSGVLTPDRSGFGKRIALTFDDGPNPSTTPRVLDILKREGIQATFFINGSRVKNSTHEDILRRIIDEGHILANHGHKHTNFTEVGSETARSLVSDTQELIGEFSTPEFFRFPYGASTCNTASIVRDEFGQVITGWNVDSGDWCYAANGGTCPASAFKHIPNSFRNDMSAWTMQQVRNKGGGIVLFHDIHEFTTNSLEGIIGKMRAEGYTFTNLDDEETFPLLNGVTLPWIGDGCENDVDCVYGGSFDEGLCELPVGMCTMECEGTCPDRGTQTTFCVSLDEDLSGSCLIQASPGNGDCANYPNLRPEVRDRFIGSSNASARTSRVCVPAQ